MKIPQQKINEMRQLAIRNPYNEGEEIHEKHQHLIGGYSIVFTVFLPPKECDRRPLWHLSVCPTIIQRERNVRRDITSIVAKVYKNIGTEKWFYGDTGNIPHIKRWLSPAEIEELEQCQMQKQDQETTKP